MTPIRQQLLTAKPFMNIVYCLSEAFDGIHLHYILMFYGIQCKSVIFHCATFKLPTNKSFIW